MIHFNSRFLRPNKALRLLHALTAIEGNPRISQHQLARKVGISSAMANSYVKDLVAEGWIHREGRTNRTMRYQITPVGLRQKRELLMGSSIEIIRMYALVRAEFEERLSQLSAKGVDRLALFGAAETGELAMAAARRSDLTVVAVADNDARLHGQAFHGVDVIHPDALWNLDIDAILITSFAHSAAIHEQLRVHEARGIKVFKVQDGEAA